MTPLATRLLPYVDCICWIAAGGLVLLMAVPSLPPVIERILG